MRALRPAILLLCLLAVAATPALAQDAPAPPMLELSIEPFEGLVAPLQGPVVAAMQARVSCLMLHPSMGTPVSFELLEAPAWAKVVISPATATTGDAASCDGEAVTVDAQLSVTADDHAPAFAPAPIRVAAHAGSEPRRADAEAWTNVTAGYFGILDVAVVSTPVVKIAPGDSHDFVLALTNFGNDRTRVEAVLLNVTDGLEVALFEPVELGSQQRGDDAFAADVHVRVGAHDRTGFINEVNMVEIRLLSGHAENESLDGDESTVSFVVTVQSFAATQGEGGGSRVPALAAPPLMAALVAVALALRRAR